MQASTYQALLNALGPARLARYLAASRNDPVQAMALYRWNASLSGALFQSMGLLEVTLRNAIDEQLQLWNVANGHSSSWLQDPAGGLARLLGKGTTHDTHRKLHDDVLRSRRDPHHPRYGQPISHDDLLAQTNFGQWSHLLPRRAELMRMTTARNRIWVAQLHAAFPHSQHTGLLAGVVIQERADAARQLRNRIAHQEPLIHLDISKAWRSSILLIQAIDPVVASYYAGTSKVPQILKARPQ